MSPMASPARTPDPENRELTSWKEIAAYLGRSVRTVQNWKRDYGLPVRPGVTPRSVSAWTHELDNWKRSRPAESSVPPARPMMRRVTIAIAAACLLAAGLSTHTLLLNRNPAFFRFENNKFIVLDSNSRELWTIHNPADLSRSNVLYSHLAQAAIVDLNNDGSPEVLVAPHLVNSLANSLQCYSADGKLLWKHIVDRVVRTAEEEYSGRHLVQSFAVLEPDATGKRRVAVTTVHELYWPSAVTLLDSDGKSLRQFWHGGHLGSIAVDGTKLFVGGTRNYTNEAVLVVLDTDSMSGASVEDPAHQLLGLGPERLQARIAFPRSCLNRFTAAMSTLNRIDLLPGELIAHTLEQIEAPSATLTWSFRKDLSFKGVNESSNFTKEKANADPKCLASETLTPRKL